MTDPMRDRILQLVQEYPGLHLREVARQLDTSIALVEYHIPGLEEEGLVDRVEADGVHRIYPVGEVDERLAVLRDAKRLHIALRLLDGGTMRHIEIARATGMGKSTVSFHLRRMEDAGITARTDDGITLVDPRRIRRLLDRHQPTPDLVDRFTDLWGDLYG